MSPFVVHFTKPASVDELTEPGAPQGRGLTRQEFWDRLRYLQAERDDGELTMRDILGLGQLLTGSAPQGSARRVKSLGESQHVVSLSEVPLHLAKRIARKRSNHGIGFGKEWLIQHGGIPTWYVDQRSQQAKLISKLVREHARGGVDADHSVWQLTPHIDQPGWYGKPQYYEEEREWRVVGALDFEPADVAFLMLPEALHDAARAFFSPSPEGRSGPSYLCPYIDVEWPLDRIRDALA
jgi:hypothetical protein